MTTKNARVWDADNQERPEEPNAVARIHGGTSANNAYLTALNEADSIYEKVHAGELTRQFRMRVELPDSTVWEFDVLVDWVPDLSVQAPRKVVAP